MPSSMRWASRGAAAAVWGGSAAALGVALVAAPAVLLAWKGIVLAGAGAAVAGRKVGHVVFQRQLRKLACGDLPLAQLESRNEGELVVVRGRIEASDPLTGILVDTPGVYRRLVWEPAGRWVSEAAVDFALIDGEGHRVLVQTAGARWMVGPREPWSYPVARFDRDGLHSSIRELARRSRGGVIKAAERVLELGALIQVVGYKTASADVGGTVVDYRSPPQRATLRSGPGVPLVISLVSDLESARPDD
jgi:hypothetical protein